MLFSETTKYFMLKKVNTIKKSSLFIHTHTHLSTYKKPTHIRHGRRSIVQKNYSHECSCSKTYELLLGVH